MLVLKCEFCETSQTPIESDMRTHLMRNTEMRGKGPNMDYRVGFVIDRIKQKNT